MPPKTLSRSQARELMGLSPEGGTQKPLRAQEHKQTIVSELESGFGARWAQFYPDLPLEREHRFHPVRKWRFDFCHIESKTAIEIEGGIWTNGAHTRGKHFESDAEKYNSATAMGFALFRLSGGMACDVDELEAIAQTIRARLPRPAR